jgi:hypothetical protein
LDACDRVHPDRLDWETGPIRVDRASSSWGSSSPCELVHPRESCCTTPAAAPRRPPHHAGRRTAPAAATTQPPHHAGRRATPAAATPRPPHRAGRRTAPAAAPRRPQHHASRRNIPHAFVSRRCMGMCMGNEGQCVCDLVAYSSRAARFSEEKRCESCEHGF